MDTSSTLRFAADLRAVIEAAGFKQTDLVKRLTVSRSSLSDGLTGKSLIPMNVLKEIIKLCKADESAWMKRWAEVHQDRRGSKNKPTPPAGADLAKIISQALGTQKGLPSGATVEIVIKIQVP